MKKELAEILGLSGASYGVYNLGYLEGSKLYNLIYSMPQKFLGSYSWFNYSNYVNMIQHYHLNNADHVAGLVSGLLSTVFFLLAYGYVKDMIGLLKSKKYQ